MNFRTSTRTVSCVVLFASSFVVALGPSQHAAEPETVLVSVNSAGTGSGNSLSFGAAMSADGGLVAFISFAGDLVANDTNRKSDVFARSIRKKIRGQATQSQTRGIETAVVINPSLGIE